MPIPATRPLDAPIIPIITASKRIKSMIFVFVAPNALSVPSSFVLSVTDVYSVVTIPTPPTIKDMNPILPVSYTHLTLPTKA